MSKIWIVQEEIGPEDGSRIVGVFDNQDKAKEYRDQREKYQEEQRKISSEEHSQWRKEGKVDQMTLDEFYIYRDKNPMPKLFFQSDNIFIEELELNIPKEMSGCA